MIQYAREIAFLLRGRGRELLGAFVLCGVSAMLDMICMVLLPVFLFTSLTGSVTLGPYLPFAHAVVQWFPTYASLVGAVVAAFVLRGALSLYVASRLTRLSETIRAGLIRRLAGYYLYTPFEQFTRRSVAWAQTTIGAYTLTFAHSVALPLLRLLLDLLTIVAILGLLVLVDHRVVGLTALSLATVAVAYYLLVRRASARESHRLAELQASFSQQLSRSLHAPREVRVLQLQAPFLRSLGDVLDRSAEAQSRLATIGSLPRVLGELTLIGLALAYLVYRTRGGADPTVMISQLGLLAFAGLRLLSAFAQGLSNVAALRSGRHTARLLAQELQGIGEPPAAAPTGGPAAPFESMELRNVSFTYAAGERPMLEGAALRIKRGDSVGIMGSSGAGKSTLGDLLLGLLVPTGGEVLVNGRPTRLDTPDWWRVVGFVPQAVFLTNDTLLRNIAFGVPDAAIDRERALRAASLAQLDEVIAQLPDGLDGAVGDYGMRLSGGQRQRVAIARALYHQRQLLVLDEATSALDEETEKAIVRSVKSLRGNVTTVIIAHRLSTLEHCNVLLEVRDGSLHRVPPGASVTAVGA